MSNYIKTYLCDYNLLKLFSKVAELNVLGIF